MIALKSYVGGAWVQGTDPGETLLNPATEEALATAAATGIGRASARGHPPVLAGAGLVAQIEF